VANGFNLPLGSEIIDTEESFKLLKRVEEKIDWSMEIALNFSTRAKISSPTISAEESVDSAKGFGFFQNISYPKNPNTRSIVIVISNFCVELIIMIF